MTNITTSRTTRVSNVQDFVPNALALLPAQTVSLEDMAVLAKDFAEQLVLTAQISLIATHAFQVDMVPTVSSPVPSAALIFYVKKTLANAHSAVDTGILKMVMIVISVQNTALDVQTKLSAHHVCRDITVPIASLSVLQVVKTGFVIKYTDIV